MIGYTIEIIFNLQIWCAKYICLHMKTHIKDYLLDFFSYHSNVSTTMP
jgi:hypothetical protein